MTTIKNQNPNTKPSKTGKIKKRSVEMTIALLGDVFNLPRELTKKIEKDTFWADWKPSLLPKDFVDECDTQIADGIRQKYKNHHLAWYRDTRYDTLSRLQHIIFTPKLKLQEKLYWKTIVAIEDRKQNIISYTDYVDRGDGKMVENSGLYAFQWEIQRGKIKPYKKLYVKSWDRV